MVHHQETAVGYDVQPKCFKVQMMQQQYPHLPAALGADFQQAT